MEKLDWDWKTPEEFKLIVEKWAYDENLYFMEQDEDLMFYNIKWTEAVFPFMFDEKCVKREYIINNFLEYMRTLFLNRNTNDINLIEKNFINDMVAYYSVTNDYNIERCIEYFYDCKVLLEKPKKPDLDYVKYVGRVLLNGKTNLAKINEPTITTNGNYEITSVSSITCYLYLDKNTGHYQYNRHRPVSE